MKTDKLYKKEIDAFYLKKMLQKGWTVQNNLGNGKYIVTLPKLIKGKAN